MCPNVRTASRLGRTQGHNRIPRVDTPSIPRKQRDGIVRSPLRWNDNAIKPRKEHVSGTSSISTFLRTSLPLFYSARTFSFATKETYGNRSFPSLVFPLASSSEFLTPLLLSVSSRAHASALALSLSPSRARSRSLVYLASRYKIHFIATATTNRYFSFLSTSSQSDKRMTRRLQPARDAINGYR